MAKKMKKDGEEEAWNEYLSSIEKQEKAGKKSRSIGETLKRLLENIGIGKEKKAGIEELKKQVAISVEEARQSTQKKLTKAGLEKGAGGLPGEKPGEKAIQESMLEKAAKEGVLEKAEMPGDMEKYLEKVEEKKRAEGRKRTLESAKKEEGKKAQEEKTEEEKRELPKKALQKETPAFSPEKKALPKAVSKSFFPQKKGLPKAVSKSFFSAKKKVLLLPAAGEKAGQAKENVAVMPKTGKEPAGEKGGKKAKKKPVRKGREPKKKMLLHGAKKAEKRAAGAGKKREKKEKAIEAKKTAKKAAAPLDEEIIAAFLKPGPSLAKKSVEEIKKLPPKQIKKELAEQRIEDKARGWYGDALRHKKAAVSGWRLRKRVKLHQLRKKQKMQGLSEQEKKAMKKLVAEDKELRNRITELDRQLGAFKKIAREKKKQGRALEKKIRATGIIFPEKEIQPVEGRENKLKKGEMALLVETMKKIADEMAASAARESVASLESEEAMPIDDRIKTQEDLIKNLERSFYKRKIDFDQFREKMFEYQSKLTELKIRKKIHDEKMKNLTPEMRLAIERRIAAGEVGKGIGIPSKTTEALEKLAAGKKEEEETGAEAIKAIKSIAEKQAKEAEKEAKEKGQGEKTASILDRIVEKLGHLARLGGGATAGEAGAEKPAKEAQQKPAMKAGREIKAKEAVARGKVALPKYEPPVYAAPGQRKMPKPPAQEKKGLERQAAAQSIRVQAPAYQQPPKTGAQQQPYQKEPAPPKEEPAKKEAQAYMGTQHQGQAYSGPRQMEAGQGKGAPEQPTARKETLGPQYQQTVYIAPRQGEMPTKPVAGMPRPAADFYEEEKPGKAKKGLFRSLRYKISGRPVSSYPVSEQVERAIMEKAARAGISRADIDPIEKSLGRLLKKYNIPENIITSHIKALDEGSLVQDFQRLINLIEDKRENAADELSRLALDFDVSAGITPQKKEKIEAHEKDIRMARIETSFDKVLALVQIKGIISLNEAAAQLGMRKEEIQQCAEILERNRLINLNYPPIGSVKLIYPAYLKWKAEEKKKEAEKKRKQKKKK